MRWKFGAIPDREKRIVHRACAPGHRPRPAGIRGKPRKRRGRTRMASKLKQTQLRRKEQYERKLKNRLALLAERKMEPARMDRDAIVKNLRAQIEAADARLKAIAAIEKRTEDQAKAKADKAAAEKAAREAPAKAAEGGREKKEKAAKAPAEGQEKKEKKEKKKKEEKPE